MGRAWLERGWQVFPTEAGVLGWVEAARAPALAAAKNPQHQKMWLRHGGTWFAGVDVLENDAEGRVPGGPALAGAALKAGRCVAGAVGLHRAQVSVTYPGYPGRDPDETDAAHRYRLRRDAAHVDGLLPVGPDRRRFLREPHGFILGLPLTRSDPRAAPLVVYEGSHAIMRSAFERAFAGVDAADWSETDVTEIYQAMRRQCFETCRRVEIHAVPGEAILLHRLVLHGIAPWAEHVRDATEGRALAYFRPLLRDITDWLRRE